MVIADLLAAFGERQMGAPLTLGASGVCRLRFGERHVLDIEPIDGSDLVHAYAAVAPLPSRNATNVYGKLLTANLFGAGTGGAVLAVDPSSEEILLVRSFESTHLDLDGFERLILGLMDQVERWAGELAGPDFAELEEEPEAGALPRPAAPAAADRDITPLMIRG